MSALKPRILALDLSDETTKRLREAGLNVSEGALGKIVDDIDTTIDSTTQIEFEGHYPKNIHEFDILIADLNNPYEEAYDLYLDRTSDNKGDGDYFECSPITRRFDERVFTLSLIKEKIENIKNRPFIVILFAGPNEKEVVDFIKIQNTGAKKNTFVGGLYDICGQILPIKSLAGQDVEVCAADPEWKTFLKRYESHFNYYQTFGRKNDGYVIQVDHFLLDINGEVISLSYTFGNFIYYIFPDLSKKKEFIFELLTSMLPTIYPKVFESLTTFYWLSNEKYLLPNVSQLLKDKKELEDAFKAQIAKIDEMVNAKEEQFQYLKDLITETGEKLTKAVATYLIWLDFEDVVLMDERGSKYREDIRVQHSGGLLIIEVKGLQRTSTDSDCSQIAKNRRKIEKERKKPDVYALYIVNHERLLPPADRLNPPFSPDQIEDAITDERGLLTTWELFRLYKLIEGGLMTKEYARSKMLSLGLVEFKPETDCNLGKPDQVVKNRTVAAYESVPVELSVGQFLILEQNDGYELCEIRSLQVNNESVSKCKANDPVGIMLNKQINKSCIIYTTPADFSFSESASNFAQ